MKIGDKVEVIGRKPGGGQQFEIGEIVEIIRVSFGGLIKCSNGGNEQWWLNKSEYKLCESLNIQSLHGAYFTATIGFDEAVGRISVDDCGIMYLCQDTAGLAEGQSHFCRDFFGYKFAWGIYDDRDLPQSKVFNLKILPSPIEYHLLFQEILAKRGPTWSEDGSYSVIPNEVLAKIHSFLEGIKEFDAKNLGK